MQQSIAVSDISVEVVRKNIKHMYVRVYAPDGRVRVSAPRRMAERDVRAFVRGKLGWIRRQQARFAARPRSSPPEMVSGERHAYRGQGYRLAVRERDAPPQVEIGDDGTLSLTVPPGATTAQRKAVLEGWYRRELKALLPGLIAQWEPVLGVDVAEWGVKRMKTRWGSCNVTARRIWLNLDLIKKPPHCLEYVVVHEMVHLLERLHTDRFYAYMDEFMPKWQCYRDELNRMPIAHQE